MKIQNDKFIFEASDMSQLSGMLQKALSLWPAPVEDYYTQAVNAVSESALKNAQQLGIESLSELAKAIVIADPVKSAQAKAFIDQAKEVLDVKDEKDPAVSLNPTAEPAVQKTK